MSTSERLHRTDAERTAPLRDASTYLRDPPSDDADPHAPDSPESAVAHGVRQGYKVIEEQILQGKLLAQRLGKASGGLGGLGGLGGFGGAGATASAEVNGLVERVLGLYKDVGKLCVEAVETAARNPSLRSSFAGFPGFGGFSGSSGASGTASASPDAAHPASRGAAAEPTAVTRFTVEVASRRRAQVTLDLNRTPAGFVPRVHALHAADPSIPALTAVSFEVDAVLGGPMLRVEVPDTQPPALYTGVVVDSASNEPRGSVTVRLQP
jgi:hypothetical protein